MMSEKMTAFIKGSFIVLGFLVIIGAIVALMTWLTMVFWNAVMPDVFNLPRIGFWQAFFLQCLSNILLKSHCNYKKKKD
jgi:hypothetical protein